MKRSIQTLLIATVALLATSCGPLFLIDSPNKKPKSTVVVVKPSKNEKKATKAAQKLEKKEAKAKAKSSSSSSSNSSSNKSSISSGNSR